MTLAISPPPTVAGPLLFARYAYPPNERGFCGPTDHRALLEYGAAHAVDPGLAELARGFQGAWPYLRFIAGVTGIGDPLDRRVVESYWLGDARLDAIDRRELGRSLEERFRGRAGRSWSMLAEAIPAGVVPTHAFHVFGVYPWVGLLDRGDHPLHVLDRCRIRWGQVTAIENDHVVVWSQPLEWTGRFLRLGRGRLETARRARDGLGFVDRLAAGDWVSLHWSWVCDVLSSRQLANLRHYQQRQLDITNHRLAHPGPMIVLG